MTTVTRLQEQGLIFILDEYFGVNRSEALVSITESSYFGSAKLVNKFETRDLTLHLHNDRWFVKSPSLENSRRMMMRINGANERLAQIKCCYPEPLLS